MSVTCCGVNLIHCPKGLMTSVLLLAGCWWSYRLPALSGFVFVMNDPTAAGLWWAGNEHREPASAVCQGRKVPMQPDRFCLKFEQEATDGWSPFQFELCQIIIFFSICPIMFSCVLLLYFKVQSSLSKVYSRHWIYYVLTLMFKPDHRLTIIK